MDLADPNQWHAYTYANNSPVTFMDPDGRNPVLSGLGAVGEGLWDFTVGGVLSYFELIGDQYEIAVNRWSNVASGEWTLGEAWDDYVENSLIPGFLAFNGGVMIWDLWKTNIESVQALAAGDLETAAYKQGYVNGAGLGMAIGLRGLGLGRRVTARGAARAAADDAQRAGVEKATAEALVLEDGTIYSAISGGKGMFKRLHPDVQKTYTSVPKGDRAKWHGACALGKCVSKALYSGRSLKGAKAGSARVRPKGDPEHGAYVIPCESCAHLMSEYGLVHVDGGHIF